MIFKFVSRFVVLVFLSVNLATAQTDTRVSIARMQYRGGGDWYNDPSALRNLMLYAQNYLPISLKPMFEDVELGSRDLHRYPFAFMTGHGGMIYNELELDNIRTWLDRGGFLYIDDDYGFDQNVRAFIKDLYPEETLFELPFDHPIYSNVFRFPQGLPKVHKHDNKPPQGLGIFRNGRLVLFYTYESNLGDGWADKEVHGNPESLREKALQMGVNILTLALIRP